MKLRLIKLPAGGAIGMLLALLIISLLFIFMIPALKDVGGGLNFGANSINRQSVESKVDQQVKEIENIRSQSLRDMEKINQEY